MKTNILIVLAYILSIIVLIVGIHAYLNPWTKTSTIPEDAKLSEPFEKPIGSWEVRQIQQVLHAGDIISGNVTFIWADPQHFPSLAIMNSDQLQGFNSSYGVNIDALYKEFNYYFFSFNITANSDGYCYVLYTSTTPYYGHNLVEIFNITLTRTVSYEDRTPSLIILISSFVIFVLTTIYNRMTKQKVSGT